MTADMTDLFGTLTAAGPVALIAVTFASLATAVISGLTGFGGGLLLPAVVAPVVGIKAVVPVLAIGQLITNASRAHVYREALKIRPTLWALAGAVPAVAASALVYTILPAQIVAIILGVFMLVSVPLRRWLARRAFHVSLAGLTAVGGAYGLAAGALSGVGMLMVPFLLGAGLAGPSLLATDAAIAVGVNGVKAGLFGMSGLMPWTSLAAGILIGLCSIPGNYIARFLLRRFALQMHTLVMEGLVIFGAVTLLARTTA